jgi:pimeloyl-ACP methyl ester carboxylesterase
MSAENGTIILVHGAWADGSCWQNVILPLRRLNLDVVCTPIPLTSLSDDIAALSRSLERTSGPVVLVGHAYAGAVIAGPTDERIKTLVYIAALAPGDGETVAQVFYREKPHPEAPHLEPDRHGLIWMPEEGFRNAVLHNASTDQKIISAAVQRPIAVKCIQEVTPTPTWKAKPTWYLLAEETVRCTQRRILWWISSRRQCAKRVPAGRRGARWGSSEGALSNFCKPEGNQSCRTL